MPKSRIRKRSQKRLDKQPNQNSSEGFRSSSSLNHSSTNTSSEHNINNISHGNRRNTAERITPKILMKKYDSYMNKLNQRLRQMPNSLKGSRLSKQNCFSQFSEDTLNRIQSKKKGDLTFLELTWRHEYVYKQKPPKKIKMIFYYICKDKSIEDFLKDEELLQEQKENDKESEDSSESQELKLQDEKSHKKVSEKENYTTCTKFTPKMITLALSDQCIEVKNYSIKQYISGKCTQELKEFHDEIESISEESTSDIDAETQNGNGNTSELCKQTKKRENQQKLNEILELQSFDLKNSKTNSLVCDNKTLDNSHNRNSMHNSNDSGKGFEQEIIKISECSEKSDKGKKVIDDNVEQLCEYHDLSQDEQESTYNDDIIEICEAPDQNYLEQNKSLSTAVSGHHDESYSDEITISDDEDDVDTDIKEIDPEIFEPNMNHEKVKKNQIYIEEAKKNQINTEKVKQELQTQSAQTDPKFRNENHEINENSDEDQSEKDSDITIEMTEETESRILDEINKASQKMDTESLECDTTEETEKQNFEGNTGNIDSQESVSKTSNDAKKIDQSGEKIITKPSTEKVDLNTRKDTETVNKPNFKRKDQKYKSEETSEIGASYNPLNTKKSGKSIEPSEGSNKIVKNTKNIVSNNDTELEEEKVVTNSKDAPMVKDLNIKLYNQASPKSSYSDDLDDFSDNIKELDTETDCDMPPICRISSPTESIPLHKEYHKKKYNNKLSRNIIEKIKSGDLPRINVVFDLDHTLIYSLILERVTHPPDQELIKDLMETHRVYEMVIDKDKTIEDNNKLYNNNEKPPITNEKIMYYVACALKPLNKQHTSFDILSQLSEFADLYVNTASLPTYCDGIIKILDPEKKYFRSDRIYSRRNKNLKSLSYMFDNEVYRNLKGGRITDATRRNKIKEMKRRTIIVDDSYGAWATEERGHIYQIKKFMLGSQVSYENTPLYWFAQNYVPGINPAIISERLNRTHVDTSKQLKDFYEYVSQNFLVGLYGCDEPLESPEIIENDQRSVLKGYKFVIEYAKAGYYRDKREGESCFPNILMTMGAEVIEIGENIKKDPQKIYKFMLSEKVDFILYFTYNPNQTKGIQVNKYTVEEIELIKQIQELMEGDEALYFLDFKYILPHFFGFKHVTKDTFSRVRTKVITK